MGNDNALAYLGARAKMAMARVMLDIDQDQALEFIDGAVRDVVNLSREFAGAAPADSPPWPIRSEPVLLFVFERAEDFAAREHAFDAQCSAEVASRRAQHLADQEATRAWKQKYIAETPDAATMLHRLEAGECLELSCHSLEWDEEFGCLAGTNAYGVDYYWGAMTLKGVDAWRTRLLSGNDIGPCPPGCDGDDSDDYDEIEQQIWEEHVAAFYEQFEPELRSLESAAHWCVNDRLELLPREHLATLRGDEPRTLRTCTHCSQPPLSPNEARALFDNAVYPHRRCCQRAALQYANDLGRREATFPPECQIPPEAAIATQWLLLWHWELGVKHVWTSSFAAEAVATGCHCSPDGSQACTNHQHHPHHASLADGAMRRLQLAAGLLDLLVDESL